MRVRVHARSRSPAATAGSYECKLCLTLHLTEGSYLAHTQGKKHQQNLARRNAMMQRERGDMPTETRKIAPRKIVKV